MSSPYYFASILDEHARRQEHIEIVKENGERMLLVGKVPQVHLEIAPVADEPKRGAKWMEPAPVRPMPESDWTVIDWLVIAMFAGFLISFLAGWFE
jgi:hypothetical protein